MKMKLLDNRWTVEVTDIDIRDCTKEQARSIAERIAVNTVVVIRDQHLTHEDEVRFCELIGNVQKLPKDDPQRHHKHMPPEQNGVFQVTEGGLFGHKEVLDWHANQPSNPNRCPLIWLYAVKGSKGSKTSWINMIEAYKDLPEREQEELKDIQVYCGYRATQGYTQDTFFKDHINTDNPIDLVYTNNLGRTGLFFPFYQILGMRSKTDKFWDMKDHKELLDEQLVDYNWTRNSFFIPTMQKLRQHVEQEKYTYHHDWEDGDIVISEQWLSIHKRWPFEDMKNRLLHRIAFGYENL